MGLLRSHLGGPCKSQMRRSFFGLTFANWGGGSCFNGNDVATWQAKPIGLTQAKDRRPMITRFENKGQKVIPRYSFAIRMARAIGLWAALTVGGLAIGMAGYAITEGMGFADAFVNAAMRGRAAVNKAR